MRELFKLFPQPGKPRFEKEVLTVWTRRGQQIHTHSHPEWTLVYYVTVGDPVCAIMVDGERVEPQPGCALLLPPDTPHSVEVSKSVEPRLSIALRWEHDSQRGDVTQAAA